MRICYKCNYATSHALTVCPQCGQQQFRTTGQIRRLGWVLAVLGAFLIIFMTWISISIGSVILYSNYPGARSHFTGGPGMIMFIVGLFGIVLTFGIASFSAGIFQIKYGRRNKGLTTTIMVLGAMFMIVAGVVRVFV